MRGSDPQSARNKNSPIEFAGKRREKLLEKQQRENAQISEREEKMWRPPKYQTSSQTSTIQKTWSLP